MLSLTHISNPGEAIIGVIMMVACAIAGSFPILRFIGWWSEGTVDGGLAFIASCSYFCLLMGVILLPPALAIVAIIIIFSSAAILPTLAQASDKHKLKQIDDERYENYAAVLERDPMNHPARMAIAESLHKEGKLKEAIEQMEWVLQAAPGLSMSAKPKLDSWKRELARVGIVPNIFCHRCRAENPPNATHCLECHQAFGLKLGMKQSMDYDGGPLRILRAWIVGSTVVSIVLFVLVAKLEILYSASIIGATTIVGAWLFLKWVGGDMGVSE